jgi:hypothetical protein
MISQADIIRTLVNQNCTDESIMSTALSPDCTPPKLLEKFTEAERFDLALDVSMKLGWDVLPLWKTWALRCLKNYNFQGAREKFRHCFQRIRSPNGRSNLLCDILKALVRMRENKMPLSDEIELIKQRKSLNQADVCSQPSGETSKIDVAKPKIFAECMHYLQEYGNNEQRIKFYIDNQLWEQAVNVLIECRGKISLDRYFINDVISYTLTTGNFDNIVAAFLKHDPGFEKSSKYFEVIYKYFVSQRRFNTLYYVQNEIGDHVAAAENQVKNFFLRKPMINYKELNQRLLSLISARDNYLQHLNKFKQSGTFDGKTNGPKLKLPEFFSELSEEETVTRLQNINNQIEITRNFSINEVTGCINGIEVVVADDTDNDDTKSDQDTSPVTWFDRSERRRTFLAALIMIYYDINCDTYFSDSGFELSNRLCNEYRLDKLRVFKTAMHIILEDESSNIVKYANLLLKRLQDDYLACTKRTKPKSISKTQPKISNNENSTVMTQPIERTTKGEQGSPKSPDISKAAEKKKRNPYMFEIKDKSVKSGTQQAARLLCDEVIRDSILVCREPDYKTELSKLLSAEARIELNIELGKLSIAQRLAFDMNRPDYVAIILKEAERLNQDHVKDVCQHWLAKH